MRFCPALRSSLIAALAVAIFSSPALAGAGGSAASAQAAAAAATFSGSVHDGTGRPVPGAKVTVTGPVTRSTTTAADGSFTLSVPPGLYRISISRGGYDPVALADLTALDGTTTPLSVTMTQQNLSSLRTIGSVSTNAHGGSIYAGPAVSTFTSGSAFANLANPQINSVLEHVPGVVVQHMGSQPDTSIILGGVQPYETQVLVDGHPLALGQYGVWTSQYFPSWLVGGVETQSGPGNTTPFANIAVGGTVNLLTPGFTSKPQTDLTYGVDNYASQSTSFLTSGSLGRLGYVFGVGSGGRNTPFNGLTECIVSRDTPTTGTIKDCSGASGNMYQKGNLYKLKYDFTPTTSLEIGALGAFSGYNPQGTNWGTYLGPVTIKQCQTNGAVCTNPSFSSDVGKTITGYNWYEGSSVYNDQWLWDAQLRTLIGKNTTVLVRPYLGTIEPEIINGTGQAYLPKFFGPPGAALFANGTVPPANYVYPVGSAEATCEGVGRAVDPAGQYIVKNGQFECFTAPFSTFEQDKMYGTTTSIVQPFGDNLLNFS